MSFDLFGPTTKCDIKVGYISTERGFVDGIGIHEANKEAQLNPGTQFIFRNRDKIEYLNINEVNKLTPEMMLPGKMSANPKGSAGGCSGIVGLNLEGDTSKSIDDAFGFVEDPYVGGTTKEGASDVRDKTSVDFYGGGGVGVQAAPIIGIDGSILAVQVIHGGFGYKYPPIVDITDDTGQGAGVVAEAFIKTRTSAEDVLVEEFDAEEDYEEYDLEKCAPAIDKVSYGNRWSPDGKDLGKWNPSVYLGVGENKQDPIRYEIERYQDYLATLKDGTRVEGNIIKEWWSTRQKPPVRLTHPDKVSREKFDVQHHAWGGLSSNYSIDTAKSSSTFGIATALIEASFFVYTSGGQRRGLKFTFNSITGNHSFEIRADDYKDNASAEEIKIKVKRNTQYAVTTSSNKGIRDRGLLKKGTFGTGGDIALRYATNDTGTSNAIFSDIGKTAPDDDDLQVQCKLGAFTIKKKNGDIIYELKDSAAFNLEKSTAYSTGLEKKKNIKASFMNQYAISPVPPSNVAGSDNSGKTYTFEWEEEFRTEGEYIFNCQCDNEAKLYIDNDPVDNFQIGFGGAAGHVLSKPSSIKKYLSAGVHKITLDLLNHQIMEMKKIQTDVVPTSDEVTFTVSTASLFAAGFEISDLGIDISKEYGDGKDIKETVTKKVEYGRVYPVKLRSSNQRVGSVTTSKGIDFSGLNRANDPINVTSNGTRLALKDGAGGDTNASFTIINVTGGTAKFSVDGKGIDVKGDNVQITLNLSWNDNPRTAGTAVGSIKIAGKTWTQSGRSGSQSNTITLSGSSTIGGDNSSRIQLKTQGEKVLKMEDWTDESWDDVTCSVNNGRFYGISGNTCNFVVDPPAKKPDSTQKGERAHVFNTVDWMQKANRKLWKINPGVSKDGDFLNQFGILPFDPTAVGKIEKKVTRDVVKESKTTVKFLQENGKNYMKVTGTGKAKVFFELNVNDRPGISSLALTEIKIKANDGDVVLRRDPNRRYANERASGEFTAGRTYLVKTIGASSGSGSIIGSDRTTIGYDDDITGGYDQNGLLKITAITPINQTEKITETVMGYPDYPNASTDDYAGFHEIIWNNITFPEDGNYAISTMVDDNVTLTFSSKNNKDIVITKKGFRIRGDGRTGTGKSVERIYFKAGTYTLKANLEQIAGGSIANGNPMALAVDVKAAFISNEIEVVSAKSWNENPMGVAMTIDAPLAPPPKEPPQLQEGRCPNNPIWTTRSTTDVDKIWYPVRVPAWSKFTNRYGLSPLPPLGFKGTDGAGTVWRNKWRVELPYKGFYGVKGTVDNFGKLFIDGVEVLGPDTDKNLESFKTNSPTAKKIFLEKKTVEVEVEIENQKQYTYNTIDKKIFSTADWASKQDTTSTTIDGPKNVDVAFKISTASLYANSITLKDGDVSLFDDGKIYGGPNINSAHNINIEVGKVYDVVLTSSNTNTSGDPNGIQYNGLKRPGDLRYSNAKRLEFDDDSQGGFDVNASFTIDNVVNGNASFAEDGKSFIVKGSNVQVTLTYNWNDNPRRSGTALSSIKIGSTTWTHLRRSNGSETHTITLSDGKSGVIRNDGSNNSAIRLRNKGKNVIQMEDYTDNDWADIICSATDGEFYNLQGRTCKFRVPSKDRTEIVYGKGLTSGSTKGGVTYDGPPLSTYKSGTLGPFITPTWNTDEEYIRTHNGTTWIMTWSNVDFPETGTYDIQGEADDKLTVKLDGVPIATAEVGNGITKTSFQAPKGKRTIEFTLMNLDFNAEFARNPVVAAVKITKKTQVAKVDPRTGTAQGKSWIINPLGISAILIPPPCPKKINGVGIVTDVIITDPGNGYPPPPPVDDGSEGSGPPVILELDEIIPEDPGINYAPEDRVCVINTETGEEICYVPPKTPTTGIPPFKPENTPLAPGDPSLIDPPGGDPPPELPPDLVDAPAPDRPPLIPPPRYGPPNGYRTYPQVVVRSATGIGAKLIPILKPVIDPIGVDPDRLIQVTDLPGLKRTGYYNGKPYYGAVFLQDGIRYAGYYDTPGQKVQIYDTLQESIDAEVITPPSAIQRSGTDINSNDPRLNIPGTPDNLT